MAGPNIPTRVMMFRDFVPDKALTKYVELPEPPADIKGKEPPAELPDGVKTVWVRRGGKPRFSSVPRDGSDPRL